VSLYALAAAAWPVMAVIMLVLWLAQRRSHNAGTVDIAWAFGTGIVGMWFAVGGALATGGTPGLREWLHWLAYVLIGVGSPYWWVTLAAIPVMYVFLTRVTGISWTEQQSLRSRGDAYRRYQQTTPAFFPRPPKAAA
jgi:steroid 5-alpha reductase family enzyme